MQKDTEGTVHEGLKGSRGQEEARAKLDELILMVKGQTAESYEKLYRTCLYHIRNFLVRFGWYGCLAEDICDDITSDIYMQILNGDFDSKSLNFDVAIRNKAFIYLAEKLGVDANALRRIIRVRKICRDNDIEMCHTNAFLIMEYADCDPSYRYKLGLTEIHNAINNSQLIADSNGLSLDAIIETGGLRRNGIRSTKSSWMAENS